MIPRMISGMTRNLGAPKNWDPKASGPCVSLPIRDHVEPDGSVWMIAKFDPTPEQLALLNAGHPIEYWQNGREFRIIRLTVSQEP
jgi:hypothetical protein